MSLRRDAFSPGAIALVLILQGSVHAASAENPPASPVPDTLDEVAVDGVRERLRSRSRPRDLTNPDVVTVTRDGTTRVRLQPHDPQREIHFRRESSARLPSSGLLASMQLQRDLLTSFEVPRIVDVTFELAANVEEGDGLPAVIPFGPRTSLVNIDYARLRDTERSTLINVTNAIDPQLRRCETTIRIADDDHDFRNRFMLLGDSLAQCGRAVRSREGDLIFADGVPETLRQALRDLYSPIANRFGRLLGSEPGLVFVAWRPDSPRSNYRLEYSWSRNSLLLFEGYSWQQGFSAQQRDALWETLVTEQIARRLVSQDRPDVFNQAETSYLLLLSRANAERPTSSLLSAALPTWISACARYLGTRPATTRPPQVMFSYDCGLVLYFVYDAVARAQSADEGTVFRALRQLLAASYKRGESGIERKAFITSLPLAQRIVQGLLDGSMGWPQFVAELSDLEVQLRITADQPELAVEVLSLKHFND